jgi:hypothetical protein
VVLTKIEPRDVDGKTEIVIEGTGPLLQYTSFQLTEPLRLVVDISDADISKFTTKMDVNSGAILDITPSQKDTIARLEIALSQAVDTKVYQSDGNLCELAKPVEEAKAPPEAVAPAPPPEVPSKNNRSSPKKARLRLYQPSRPLQGKKVPRWSL